VSLGIGDVSFPVVPHVANKMNEAIKRESGSDFVGYGNYCGIPELIDAIRVNEYPNFSNEEIYVSDGTKTDSGSILEMFSDDALIGIYNPTYPIYLNGAYSLNKKFELIDCDSDFNPAVPNKHFDVLYICSPSNPTGINYSMDVLKPIIDYALREDCVIIYDNVYFRFIKNGVKSIYEVEGARKCAIELRSFSKHASFTGIRCSYYVVPNDLQKDINKFWRLRTVNRFNGASYIAQVGALASFDEEAKKDIDKNIEYYKNNVSYLLDKFSKLGYEVSGGVDAPYVWVKCKDGLNSWEAFERFLNEMEIIIVPGIIFGNKGDGYFRASALGKYEDIVEAMNRIEKYEKN
jgi:LL-diaminopimelate aminotransferase